MLCSLQVPFLLQVEIAFLFHSAIAQVSLIMLCCPYRPLSAPPTTALLPNSVASSYFALILHCVVVLSFVLCLQQFIVAT